MAQHMFRIALRLPQLGASSVQLRSMSSSAIKDAGSGGFLIPVEVRPCIDNPAKGHGVFSLVPIAKGSVIWQPGLVTKLSPLEAAQHLRRLSRDETHTFLRQAFVTAEDPHSLCVNPTDPGRFVNHCSPANLLPGLTGGVATRDIGPGEELTCDYSGLASPPWYQALCDEYGVLSTADVVAKYGST